MPGTKTWNTTSAKPRPSHAAMNGETVPLYEEFSNGMQWPGDPSGGAGEVAGCTCVIDVEATLGEDGIASFLTEEEADAMQTYVDDYEAVINTQLCEHPFDPVIDKVKVIDDVIAREAPLTEDLHVVRGFGNFVPDERFIDYGFTSTSLSRDIAVEAARETGTVVEIIAPKGTRVYSYAKYGDEATKEILLPRGGAYELVEKRQDRWVYRLLEELVDD